MIYLFLAFLLIPGCMSSSVKFRSKESVQVRLIEPNGHVSEEVLGTTPFTVPSEKVVGKILSVQAPRRIPQTWFFVPTEAHELEVSFNLERDDDFIDRDKDKNRELERLKEKDLAAAKSESLAQKNKFLRLILASYQALSQDDAAEALRLAQEAALQQGDLAAPEILRGLALLKLRKLDQAKQAFKRAKILDPNDPNIDLLIKSLDER